MKRRLQLCLTLAIGIAVAGLSPASSRAADPSKFDTLTKGMTKKEGVLTLYHNDQKLYGVIKTADFNQNFIVVTSIARGISSGMVLGGMSWGFGDDAVWSFKKVGDRIHVVRRNVRYKAKAGTPEADAVKLAYSDSVLYALPILTDVSGGHLVDLTSIFMSDDQQIGRAIGPGFRFVGDRSTWAKVKAFPQNLELQVAAIYTGQRGPETVVDPRGVQVNVHYSISKLPSNSYKPRVADDRIGYFMTVIKDFSNEDDDQHFLRYINRWNLQKEDPKATLSRAVKPIRFYIEKTVPKELRPYIQEGIEEWNKAFEKLGYYRAIEVLQQTEADDWDPEDIRYNTFRWITADAGFAMGPSRVNPFTGEILDADIIFDSSFLRYWRQDYETFSPEDVSALMTGSPSVKDILNAPTHGHQHRPGQACMFCRGMQHQMGFAASVLLGRGETSATGELPEKFITQALKEVVMHEVGHTLGLRHNFKASTWKSLEQMSQEKGGPIVASVMDYSPANIAPKGEKQGDYYSQSLGPYDMWAIEYGYKHIASKEEEELKKIASRGAEEGHHYSTDEDTRSTDSDPLSNRFDLGKDPVSFAARQMKVASEMLPHVVKRSVKDGEGYQRARQAFGMLFSEYWRSAFFAARFPGGVQVNRDHKGDKDARPPFEIVSAEKQRAAMKLIADTAFAPAEYDPEVLNHLAATRWSHWGMRSYLRLDYPIHDTVAMMQSRILSQLTSPMVLGRLHDSEIKVKPDEDVYTLAEHMRLLVGGVFSEITADAKPGEYTNRKPYITSFRRNLQRMALKELATMVTFDSGAPEDARTLALMHLRDLDTQIDKLLVSGRDGEEKKVKLDDYTRAHLIDSKFRIKQVLETGLTVNRVN